MARSLLRRRGHLLATCRRERSVAILLFCYYDSSEVIQKQVLLAKRLLLSLRFFASDKSRGSDKPRAKTKIPSVTKASAKEETISLKTSC